MSKDVCQAVASPTALRGSDPVSEHGIEAFEGHLIKWLNAAKLSREKSVLRLMILEALAWCWIWWLDDGRRVGRVEPVSPVICAKSRGTGLGPRR